MRSDSRTPCILIADDQPDVLEALRFLVKGEGYQAESVNSPRAVIDAVESRDFGIARRETKVHHHLVDVDSFHHHRRFVVDGRGNTRRGP